MTHDASDHVDTADARSAVLQVLAVGATTTVVLAPGAMAVGISLIFLGYFGAAGYFGALLGAVVLFVILYVIGTAFHDASPLTRSTGRRFLWAALLTIAGTGLAFYGYSVLRDIGWDPARPPSLGYLLAGVAFALVTAVLTHHRVFRVSAMAVITLFVGSTALVATVEQRGDDIANRLAAYGTEADLVFVTEITDYGRGRAPHANVAAPYTMKYAPLDGPADAEISVWATRGRSYQCPQDPPPRSDDMGVRCVEEAVGLWHEWWYGWSADQHVYIRSYGDRLIHVRASHGVPRGTLREAVMNARQVPASDLANVVPEPPSYMYHR